MSQPQQSPPAPRRPLRSLAIGVAIAVVLVGTAAGARHLLAGPAAPHAACTSYQALSDRGWLEIVRDPAAHEGDCVTVYGIVTQADTATGTDTVRAQVGGTQGDSSQGILAYPTNVIIAGVSGLVQDDAFTADVWIDGTTSYDTTLGGKTTVPLLHADAATRFTS